MIPILYDPTETEFTSNGIARLYDCIRCEVTEERNGIYELELEYPVTGAHYSDIMLGCIICAEHDEKQDIQPFDIYSFSKPINGVVTFHARHISYRQKGYVARGTGITTIPDAFNMLKSATPSNPFTYETDILSEIRMGMADGVPHTVRDFLGGSEESILDTWGGEYEFDNWKVILWQNRGEVKDYEIRYGSNLTDFNYEADYSEAYTSVVPYWKNDSAAVVGNMITVGGFPFTDREFCIPLDVSDKFEEQPNQAAVETAGRDYLLSNQTFLPSRNISVNFINIYDSDEYKRYENLQKCCLCDSVKVIFPLYDVEGTFKIVKVVWDVLQERYTEMELGNLSISLAQALGIK